MTLTDDEGPLDIDGEASVTVTAPNNPSLDGRVLYLTVVVFEGEQQLLVSPPKGVVIEDD